MNNFDKLPKWLVKDGVLTDAAANGLGISGIAVIWCSAYFFEDWTGFWFWFFMLFGLVIGYLGAYGGLAKKFGLRSFTSDPLGWRQAKRSYKTERKNDQTKPGNDLDS